MTGGVLPIAIALGGSFLAGSIPSAYLASRLAGKGDIRSLGSGNSGATNAYRVLGAKWALTVFALDFLKGFVPVLLVRLYLGMDAVSTSRVAALSCAFAVLGHVFSPWIGFRGGKGVATGAGAFTALLPPVFPVCLAFFSLFFGLSRRTSVASLAAAAALPAVFFADTRFRGQVIDPVVSLVFFAVPIIVFATHAKNLARLRTGTEAPLF